MGENNALDKQLLLFGLMRKAGRIVIGDEPVTDALRRGEVLCVCTASDAAENTVSRFRRYAQEEGIPFLVTSFDKAAFGGVFGRESVAVAGVTDLGFAARLLELDGTMAGTQEARDYRERADRVTEEQRKKRRKPSPWKSKAPDAEPETQPAPTKKKKQESPEWRKKPEASPPERKSGPPRGKIYGKAPKAQPKTIGDRRREDAARKAAKEEEARLNGTQNAGRSRGRPGGADGSRKPGGERRTRDGYRAYTEQRAKPRADTDNAPRNRNGNPTAKRGNGGKA